MEDEYSAERPPDDGKFYQKIRKYQGYQGPGDPFLESRWMALLGAVSKSKSDNMRQISRNPEFRAQFDIQMDIPALGSGMKLSFIHIVFAMGGCRDVRPRLNSPFTLD